MISDLHRMSRRVAGGKKVTRFNRSALGICKDINPSTQRDILTLIENTVLFEGNAGMNPVRPAEHSGNARVIGGLTAL